MTLLKRAPSIIANRVELRRSQHHRNLNTMNGWHFFLAGKWGPPTKTVFPRNCGMRDTEKVVWAAIFFLTSISSLEPRSTLGTHILECQFNDRCRHDCKQRHIRHQDPQHRVHGEGREEVRRCLHRPQLRPPPRPAEAVPILSSYLGKEFGAKGF